MKILVLGGPNLNTLGQRQPEVYGSETLKDIQNFVESSFDKNECESVWRQSNNESEIIEWVQNARKEGFDCIVINPAAYTHTSVAIYDSLLSFEGKIVEVHLSNTYKREEFRKTKITSGASIGVIEGFGKYSYLLAFKYLIDTKS